jgi:hypothetical protein
MSASSKRLVDLFKAMSEQQQQSLLDYASFLHHQSMQAGEESKQEKLKPLVQPKPDNENVVNAIKRLRSCYFMLNTNDLLNESSTLMAQFMLQGREADEVIIDLEQVFENHYEKYLES